MSKMNFLLSWASVFLVLFAAGVMGDLLVPGECANYTLMGNVTRLVCAENASDPSVWNGSLVLDPGESEVVTGGFCRLDASCNACSSDVDVCRKSRVLELGEDYETDDGACDLSFSCVAPEEENASAEYLVPATVKKTGENLTITIGEEQVAWTLMQHDLNIDYEVPVMCPTEVTEGNIDRFSDETLVQWATLLDFYPQLTEKVLNNGDVWALRVEKKDEELKELRTQYEVLNQDYLDCRSELNGTLARSSVDDEVRSELERKNGILGGLLTGMGFLFFVVLLYAAAMTWAYMKKRGDDQ